MNLIKTIGATIRFNTIAVLEGLNFSVTAGDFVAVVGPNGAGKTTLIRALLGLDRLSSGSIELFGVPADKFNYWKKIGYLPQNIGSRHKLLPLSAREIVELGLLPSVRNGEKLSENERKRLNEQASELGVAGLFDRPFSELSGGEQQKIMLCRALAGSPELLILDEPTAALSPQARDSFYDILTRLNREQGTTILLVTHDAGYLSHYAKKLIYIDKTLVFEGAFADFCHSDNMTKYFGAYSQHLICGQHDARG